MFQAGGLVVVVVEIFRRNFLASMVPVIVNAIINEHQLVIDIVAFVIKGDFHRSRLGEKQRGKILAGWVTRKMRTIAQYSIRDPNGPENQMMISEEPAGRASMSMSIGGGGIRAGSTKGSLKAGSSLGMAAQLNSMQLHALQSSAITNELPGQSNASNFAQIQPPIQELPGQRTPAEMSTHTPNSGSAPSYYPPSSIQELDTAHEKTPTEARHSFLPNLQGGETLDYSPIDRAGPWNGGVYGASETGPGEGNYQQQTYGNVQHSHPDILVPGPSHENSLTAASTAQEPFYSDSQPYEYREQSGSGTGRWSFDEDDGAAGGGGGGGLRVANYDEGGYTGGYGNANAGGGGGGLRVANRDSSESESGGSWTRDAIAGLNFAGGTGKK